MTKTTTIFITLVAMGLGAIHAAEAHISFAANNAYAGSSYIATANIPHGCADANGVKHDTTKVEIAIPAEFTSVRPQDTAFGSATVEKDSNGNVIKLIWTRTATTLSEDANFYQVTFRGTLPDAPLTTLEFVTTQTCEGNTTKSWEGAEVPKLRILPTRTPGWNKYTAQADIDEATIKAFFGDAYIVWSNGAAYSANPVTAGLITNTLTTIPLGAEFWVKY